ncbi:MAG: DNA-processing protein DprA [Sedimentibacter sp.]
MELNINQITLSWLNSVSCISNSMIEKLIDYFGSLEVLWDNFESETSNISILKPEIKTRLIEIKGEFEYNLIKNLNENNAKIITSFDYDYPKQLHNINDAPYILYYKGDISSASELSIAVIGSRKATSYGKWAAEKFTRELSNLGVVIVSGLASGIDSIAHRTAIECQTKTIGVIGSGIDIVYPKKNEELYKQVVEKGGCILSEFPFGMQPMPYNFPVRNRIISGLSRGVLVIEAQEKSGTLITAGHAANQGREIFAVPGNIDSIFSKGTNSLIKDGAKITSSVEDIVEEIIELREKVKHKKNTIEYNNLCEDELKILNCLLYGSKTINEINIESELETFTTVSLITFLEMKGYIKQIPGNKFILNI